MASRDLSRSTETPSGDPKSPAHAPRGALPEGVLLDSFSAGAPMLRLPGALPGEDWRNGDAVTRHGLVSVYTQGRDGTCKPHTRLDFVAAGRFYTACWQRVFQDRFLVTMAVRFAEKCTLGNDPASKIASSRSLPDAELGPGRNPIPSSTRLPRRAEKL